MSTQIQRLPEAELLHAGESEQTSKPTLRLSEPEQPNQRQLRPFDILIIQSAIEEYERQHRGRPTPTAEEALAWRLGRRGRRKQREQEEATGEPKHSISGYFRKWRMLLL